MRVYTGLLSLVVLLLTHCAPYNSYTPKQPTQRVWGKQMERVYAFVNFQQVQIEGDVHVKLQQADHYLIKVIGCVDQVSPISVHQYQQIVKIAAPHLPSDLKERPMVVICAPRLEEFEHRGEGRILNASTAIPVAHLHINTDEHIVWHHAEYLKQLTVRGSGKVELHNVHHSSLMIHSQGRATIQLQGVVRLKELHYQGQGWLQAYWVDSPWLRVYGSGNAYAQLAGTVGTLELHLQNNAHFNGRFLRSDAVYAKLQDATRADIFAKDLQASVTSDASHIFNYNRADVESSFMDQQGSVLNVQDVR